jgi:uncharacterized repeat protein (TIGR01451 family)
MALAGAAAGRASAFTTSPSWTVTAISVPTIFTAGDESGEAYYRVVVTNTGDAASDGSPVTITDTLPGGLTLATAGASGKQSLTGEALSCAGSVCTYSGVVPASDSLTLEVPVDVEAGARSGEVNVVTVAGGGAPESLSRTPIEVSGTPSFPGFGVAPNSFSVALSNDQAGAHADMTTSFYFNTDQDGTNEGNMKDTVIDLPAGFAGDATQTPLCSPAQLAEEYLHSSRLNGCPVDSQVGTITVYLNFAPFYKLEKAFLLPILEPVYNMQPQGGEVARLGFKIISVVSNVVVKVRPGDYGLEAVSPNLYGGLEVQSVQLTTWGSPQRQATIRCAAPYASLSATA